MNRDIKRVPVGTITHDDQAIASLKIVNRFINELKNAKLYDNTAMIIMADHGNHTGEAVVRNPLMLVKKQNAHGQLQISNNQISYVDLHATILAAIGDHQANKFGDPFMTNIVKNNKRRFLSYLWQVPWQSDYMPYLQEYYVLGDARLSASWHKTPKIYDVTKNNLYKIGGIVDFGRGGSSILYMPGYSQGWSEQEELYTWTQGATAMLSFMLATVPQNDLTLHVKAFPYLGGGLKEQLIGVYANDTKIATWRITDETDIQSTIPAAIIRDDTLNLVFKVNNPTSPKEVGASEDSRKLGIAVKELVITEAK